MGFAPPERDLNSEQPINFNQFFQTLNRSGRRGIQAVMRKRSAEVSAAIRSYVPETKRENFVFESFKLELKQWIQLFRNTYWRSGRVKTLRPQIRRAK